MVNETCQAIFFQCGTCENPGYFYSGRIQDSLKLRVLNRESQKYIHTSNYGGWGCSIDNAIGIRSTIYIL